MGQNPVAQVHTRPHGATHGHGSPKPQEDSSVKPTRKIRPNSQFVPFKKEKEKKNSQFVTETPRPAPSTRSATGRHAPSPPLGLDLPTTASDGRHIHSTPDLSRRRLESYNCEAYCLVSCNCNFLHSSVQQQQQQAARLRSAAPSPPGNGLRCLRRLLAGGPRRRRRVQGRAPRRPRSSFSSCSLALGFSGPGSERLLCWFCLMAAGAWTWS